MNLLWYDATVATCRAAARARGLRYAGLQNNGECFGGDELRYAKRDDGACNTRCRANPNEWCGGYYRNSVYASSDPSPTAVCLRHDALGRMVLFGNTAATVSFDGVACTSDADVTRVLARFRYDHRGRRVARWGAGTNEWTSVVSDGAGNPLSELVSTGDPGNPWRKLRDYVWLDGLPLAQVEHPGPSASSEGYAYYFHLDHIGFRER